MYSLPLTAPGMLLLLPSGFLFCGFNVKSASLLKTARCWPPYLRAFLFMIAYICSIRKKKRVCGGSKKKAIRQAIHGTMARIDEHLFVVSLLTDQMFSMNCSTSLLEKQSAMMLGTACRGLSNKTRLILLSKFSHFVSF